MKNKRGFAPIVAILIVAAVVLAGGSYYLGKKSSSSQEVQSGEVANQPEPEIPGDEIATNPTSTPAVTYPEDGEHDGYIVKAHEKDGKKYIDIDYFVTLQGKEAVLKALEYKEVQGYSLPPDVKADFLSRVNAMKDAQNYYNSVYDPIIAMYSGDNIILALPDFPNGVLLDANDNPKIRTFEVDLKSEGIILATLTSSANQVGVTKKTSSGGGYVWVVNWDVFKQEVVKIQSMPVHIQVENGKVVDMSQVYRP